MAKRYGVELSEWRTMSSKDRLLAKQAWLKQRAERVLTRKRAQQIRDRRKRYRQLYMEKIGVKKKSKKPEYIPQKSDFPMPGDPDFGGPPIPTLEEMVSDSDFVGPPRSADVEGDPSSAIIADPILSIKYGLLAPPPQLPADASQEQVLFHSKLTELQHETSLSKLEYQYTKKITRLEERRDQVNTDARYKVTDPNTGKTRVMSGWQVRKLYNKQIDRLESGKADVGEAIVEVKTTGGMFRETIRDYPAGSRFVSTPGGMQIQIPQPPAKSAYERVMDEYKTMHPVAAGVRAGAAVLIAGVFNPQTWYDVITGHPERMRESIAEWELGATEEIRSGDIGGYAFRVATSPAYTNIVYPFAAGAGFTAAFRYIGKAAAETSGAIGIALKVGSKTLPYVGVGTYATMEGVNIGMGFAESQREGFSRFSEFLTRLGFAVAGAHTMMKWEPVTAFHTKEGQLYARRFLTTWRGRPVFGYGKPVGFAETQSGIARIVSPFPGRPGMVKWETVDTLLSRWSISTPKGGWEPDLGYRAVGGKPTSIMDIRPVGPQKGYMTKWNQQLFYETGIEWQPKIPTFLIPRQPTSIVPYGEYLGFKHVEFEPLVTIRQKFPDKILEPKPISFDKHPLRKPPIRVTQKPPTYSPIKIDISEAGAISTEWYGKQYLGGDKWQPKIDTSLMVKPPQAIVPYKPPKTFPKFIDWQPKTGLTVHPSQITSQDELFNLYLKNRIVRSEYEWYRKLLEAQRQPTVIKPHPLSKPPVRVEKIIPQYPPITIDISKAGAISAEWYGKQYLGGGKIKHKTGYLQWSKHFPEKIEIEYKGPPSIWVTPKPTIWKRPGPLTIWDPLTWTAPLETGIPVYIKTPIVKLITTKTPRTFTIKDITKDIKQYDITGGQTQRTGQQTIQIPKQKPITITTQQPKTEPLIIPKQLLKPIPQYKQFQESFTRPIYPHITKTTYGQIHKQDPILSIFNLPDYETTTIQQYEQILSFETSYLFDTLTGYEFAQPSIPVIEQITEYKTPWPTITIQTKIFDIPPIPPPIFPTEIVPPPPPPDEQFQKKKRRKKKLPEFISMKQPVKHQQGYNVFVKDRIYVQGKPVNLSGSFITLNKHSLNKQNALALLGTALDHSAAQTGFIRQTDMPPQPPTTKTTPWKKLQHKFYKKNNFIVEKRSHAIDTPGEIEGISALGWLNRQPQRTKGGVVKKTKTVIEKPAGFIMDDTSTFDMMNQFENMLRRMTHGSK